MERSLKRKLTCILTACMIIAGSVMPVGAAEPFEVIEDMKPSKVDYHVELDGVANGFISNKKPVEMKAGKYYVLTYTVEKVEKNDLWQNGIVATQDNTMSGPFVKGTMHYEFSADSLLEEGCTYFFRFEMTKEGLSYVATKAEKDGTLSYISLPLPYGDIYDDCKYFGLWLGGNGGNISASLSKVLCYDAQGNDLGIVLNTDVGGGSVLDYDLLKEKQVPHSYEFSVKDVHDLAISNERATDAETIFMSYAVKNVLSNKCRQAGGSCNTDPQAAAPHGKGILNYMFCEETGSPLLHEGSQYLIRFDRNGGELKVTVKEKDSKGNVSYYGFPILYGTYLPESRFFSLWYGDDVECTVTADFSNFKCYDENGRNLAVQLNQENISIRHIGNLEDYSLCEGVYYSIDKDTFIILDDECNIGRKVDEEGQDTDWGTYVIRDDVLQMNIEGSVEEYQYMYDYMTDKEDNRYIRLKDQKVRFVTGDKEDTVTEVTAESGYKVAEPEKPEIKGYTFEGWCLGDGTVYDFDSVVTETTTLYAKYTDESGQEYITIDGPIRSVSVTKIAAITISSVLVAGTVVVCILMVKKGKKHEK